MSISKDLKHIPKLIQEELPKPSSSFSNFMPLKTIEMANFKVLKVKNKIPNGKKSVPYSILTAQWYEVSKRATEYGVIAYFAKKCQEMSLFFAHLTPLINVC